MMFVANFDLMFVANFDLINQVLLGISTPSMAEEMKGSTARQLFEAMAQRVLPTQAVAHVSLLQPVAWLLLRLGKVFCLRLGMIKGNHVLFAQVKLATHYLF